MQTNNMRILEDSNKNKSIWEDLIKESVSGESEVLLKNIGTAHAERGNDPTGLMGFTSHMVHMDFLFQDFIYLAMNYIPNAYSCSVDC